MTPKKDVILFLQITSQEEEEEQLTTVIHQMSIVTKHCWIFYGFRKQDTLDNLFTWWSYILALAFEMILLSRARFASCCYAWCASLKATESGHYGGGQVWTVMNTPRATSHGPKNGNVDARLSTNSGFFPYKLGYWWDSTQRQVIMNTHDETPTSTNPRPRETSERTLAVFNPSLTCMYMYVHPGIISPILTWVSL